MVCSHLKVSSITFTYAYGSNRYQASQEIFEIFDKVLVLQKEEDPDAPSQMV